MWNIIFPFTIYIGFLSKQSVNPLCICKSPTDILIFSFSRDLRKVWQTWNTGSPILYGSLAICWHILSHEHPSAKTLLHYMWSPEAVDLWNYDQLFCPIRFSLEQMRQVDSASWAYPISYPLPVYLPPALKIFRAVIYAHIAVALFWAVQILCWGNL